MVACFLVSGIGINAIYAQDISIKGKVTNSQTKEVIPAVSIQIRNSMIGTYSDENGNFEIISTRGLPVVLEFSAVGFETYTQQIRSADQRLAISLVPAISLGQDVVVSATRTPSRILESPVSIERISAAAIKNSPATNYYDLVTNLKGVDMITSSLSFKTPTTRGFGLSGNARFNQIVAGMDNQAPGLNFAVGSIVGLNELDVESMELLPGASSALYGPGGMNGTLLINAKNPFKYQGLSFQLKGGVMHLGNKNHDPSGYYNAAVRFADKIGEKFAYKIGVEYMRAEDWQGDDFRNYKRLGTTGQISAGTRETDPNFDGVNIYGDETTTNLKNVLLLVGQQAPFLQGFINTLPANIPVSRTGYTEQQIVDPNTINLKLSGSLHYMLTKNVEASLTGYWGNGNTVYTGSTRYSLRDLKMGQYKLELNHKNWMVRAYTTQENAGESHNLTVATQLINEAWKPSAATTGWYPVYAQTYLGARLAGQTDFDAHTSARAMADQGRPAPGSTRLKAIYDSVRLLPIPKGGLLLDRTDLWMVEGQYNFSDVVKFMDVLVGANWKKYILNSEGTLFGDVKGAPIGINEFGGYVQLAKSFFKEVLRLTASGRFDKQQNFDGKFTPRVTALVKVAKDHNVRLSYQTAYRFPTNQQQWIDLFTGNGRIMGGVETLWNKYNMTGNPVYSAETISSQNPVVVPYTIIKPESVTSFEIGYKSLIARRFLIDAYFYTSQYQNFLSRRDVVQKKNPQGPNSDLLDPSKRDGYSVVVNAPGTIHANGWGIGLDYILPANFTIGGNLSSDVLKKLPAGFIANFNAPKYRTNLTLANTGFGPKNAFGFSATYRWQETFYYESDFASGQLPSIQTVDAQVNYKIKKSIIRLGATNLANSYYRNGVGNASIGGIYYLSYSYNL